MEEAGQRPLSQRFCSYTADSLVVLSGQVIRRILVPNSWIKSWLIRHLFSRGLCKVKPVTASLGTLKMRSSEAVDCSGEPASIVRKDHVDIHPMTFWLEPGSIFLTLAISSVSCFEHLVGRGARRERLGRRRHFAGRQNGIRFLDRFPGIEERVLP